MEIKIPDVEHGFCAIITAEDGSATLIDCGHNATTGWRPSEYLQEQGHRSLHRLVNSNYDEDHLSDLPNLRKNMPIERLVRNTSVDARSLLLLKLATGGLGAGTREILAMARTYTEPCFSSLERLWDSPWVSDPPPDFLSASRRAAAPHFRFFRNPWSLFADTNNLSVVTFVEYRGISIIFPGDLEQGGWRQLLQYPLFLEYLSRVNIFVASHHGREDGYCAEVFDHCKPDLVIISDGAIEYETQKEQRYRKHARGASVGGEIRHVLTTRNDGTITIQPGGGWVPYLVQTDTSQAALMQWIASIIPPLPMRGGYGYSKYSYHFAIQQITCK